MIHPWQKASQKSPMGLSSLRSFCDGNSPLEAIEVSSGEKGFFSLAVHERKERERMRAKSKSENGTVGHMYGSRPSYKC